MIVNRQRQVRARVKELERFLARVRRTLRLGRREVTVALVSDAEIARLNRAFRGKDKATDVLSFPANAKERSRTARHALRNGTGSSYLGDVAIAPRVARRNARRFGRSVPDELRILILHGVLHLLGYDHESDNGEMNRLEQRLRGRLGIG